MATIGQPLTAPEEGWKRYDDLHPAFKRPVGNWTVFEWAKMYGGSKTCSSQKGSKVIFKFTGTRLRLIAVRWRGFPEVKVTIDGEERGTYTQNGENAFQCLMYEIVGLEDKEHLVELESLTDGIMDVDAVDIDENGRLLHPDEVTDIRDLEVGKRIRCHYRAPIAGLPGTFIGLGKETADFIPVLGSNAPIGDFYFIMVDERNGKKILIADRNIQTHISWDALNTAGIASGSGARVIINEENKAKGGVPIASVDAQPGYPDRTKENAFDGSLVHDYFWGSEYPVKDIGWIGYDFLTPTRLNMMNLVQGGAGGNLSRVEVQGSHDGSQWESVKTFDVGRGQNLLRFETKEYRCWRLLARSTAATSTWSWNVTELEMYEIKDSKENEAIIRLLTGGVSPDDRLSEWDKYIVNSDLNGTITAGDNTVWNWSGIASWTSTTPTNSSSNRMCRGYTAVGTYYTNRASSLYDSINGFRPVLIVESLSTTKYLFQDGSEIKKYVSGSGWSVVGPAPATETMIQTDGMTNLSIIDKAAVDALVSSQPKLLVWTDDSNLNKNITLTAIPAPRLVMPTGDIDIPAQGISGFSLTSAAAGQSILRVIASANGGVAWKTWNGSSWVSVDLADLSAVKANGMTPDTFNALTEDNWNALLNGSDKIRFAYYLDQDKSADTLNVDQITINGKPVATQTPTLDSLKVTYDELTIEGRLQDLERINAINISKLNFKSNALLQSEKYELHDLVIDTMESDEFTTIEANKVASNTSPMVMDGSGKMFSLSVDKIKSIKKVEVTL